MISVIGCDVDGGMTLTWSTVASEGEGEIGNEYAIGTNPQGNVQLRAGMPRWKLYENSRMAERDGVW